MFQTQDGVKIGTCDESGKCECDENALTDDDGNCYFEYCKQTKLDIGILDQISESVENFKKEFENLDKQDERRLRLVPRKYLLFWVQTYVQNLSPLNDF